MARVEKNVETRRGGAAIIGHSIELFASLFRIDTKNPELLQAQIKALSRQIPILYFIVVSNTIAVAYTHYNTAPPMMTVGFASLVTLACFARGRHWMKLRRQTLNEVEIARIFKRTVIVGGVLGACIMTWGLSLYPYGDANAHAHVVFYLGVTMICATFCQMHLRSAALVLSSIATALFMIYFLWTGAPTLVAIALNMLLVSLAMINVLLIFSRDFANLIALQQENARLANHDSLTGLPNRRQFFSRLNETLSRAEREANRFIVGQIDLDGFKSVNDLYGHVVGNQVLVEVGERLLKMSDDATVFARMGGDEFGVIVAAELDDRALQAFGLKICDALEAPYALEGVIVEISGSIGFAQFPRAGVTADQLFERADYALYHAKARERGRAVNFSGEHETAIRQLARVERCLREADFASEMSLAFQPIVDAELGAIVAFEALARWNSPVLGRVAPDAFIGVAERSDLINKLTRTLLREALAQAKIWPSHVRVSFNLSMRDLASRDAIMGIVGIIANSGVSASRIDFEVTETALANDFDQTGESLRVLKSLGVGISLDDFGTGYSSLSFLQKFPIDKIKIDRSFVRDVDTTASCRAIVKSIIDLCRNLNLTCIVEGMETEQQADTLRAMGCSTMQGYLFAKPMPGAEVPDFLNRARLLYARPTEKAHAIAS